MGEVSAPRTWGSPNVHARMGMHPLNPPHARGDHPQMLKDLGRAMGSAPRRWGSSRIAAGAQRPHRIRPTQVGIIPATTTRHRGTRNPPHVMWGSPLVEVSWGFDLHIRTTYVGITQMPPGSGRKLPDPPHARGDHPPSKMLSVRPKKHAPRTWGSSNHNRAVEQFGIQCPTHVGIIRRSRDPLRRRTIRPTYVGITRGWFVQLLARPDPRHVCGDHPRPTFALEMYRLSAPRTWGSPDHRKVSVQFSG